MVSFRVDEDLWAWVEEYARQRGVSKTSVLEAGLRDLRAMSRGGVPDLPERERAAETPLPKIAVRRW